LSWYGVRDNLTDVNEDHLAKVAFDRFVHWKLYSPFHTLFLRSWAHIWGQKGRNCVATWIIWNLLVSAEHWWLTPIILPTWEAEIRRVIVWGQSKQISLWDPISKITKAK
jgi:hypothetical protein